VARRERQQQSNCVLTPPSPHLSPPPLTPHLPSSFPDLPYDVEADIKDYREYVKKLLPYVTDTIE
jgi:hypothetical protein